MKMAGKTGWSSGRMGTRRREIGGIESEKKKRYGGWGKKRQPKLYRNQEGGASKRQEREKKIDADRSKGNTDRLRFHGVKRRTTRIGGKGGENSSAE